MMYQKVILNLSSTATKEAKVNSVCGVANLLPHINGVEIMEFVIAASQKPSKITNMKQATKMTLITEMKNRRRASTLILFRNGDNFEAYNKDAKIISEVLTLKTFIEDEFETISFQASKIEDYSNRLLDAGHSICISEMRDESGNFIINIAQDENEQDNTDNQ